MNNDPIYVITMMNSRKLFDNFHRRVVGFCHEKENAEMIVLGNYSEIYENEYDLAVIEETKPGEYSRSVVRWFYKYDQSSEKYFPCEEPEEFYHVISIGIG